MEFIAEQLNRRDMAVGTECCRDVNKHCIVTAHSAALRLCADDHGLSSVAVRC